ncbi:7TM_GPCR_Srx domain-containing protein [Meloidogyne graminicola]|uniref:7TM_GPCR_Srx domain-containing protein n=1 Tax=Meloidogyne graminicola TaxID=189291 RepID=A0A8S9ZH82_9BILA|nr:7TM_GPCR_Srx domain-containing protein [Meloidogyne graminicola]
MTFIINGQLSNNSTILGNEFYFFYRDSGLEFWAFFMAFLIACCAISGNIMNAFLVYVTAKNKTLRSSTNYLLAQHSFCEFFHQSGHYIFLYTIFSGKNFITYSVSTVFQIQSILGYNSAVFTMFETATDRLLCVLTPSFYSKTVGPIYLAMFSFLAFIPGAILAFLVINYAIENPNEAVTGQLSDICTPIELIYNYNLFMCILCIISYIIIGAIVLKKVKENQNKRNADYQHQRNAKLLRSLLAIIIIMVGSYFLNTLLRKFVNDILHLGPIGLWYVNVAGGVIVNIGAASNTPILYATSSEYRKVIDKELNSIFGKYWKITVPKPPKNLLGTTATPNEVQNVNNNGNNNMARINVLNSLTDPKSVRVHPTPINFLPII